MKPVLIENESGEEISIQTVQPSIINSDGEHKAAGEICLLIGDRAIFLTVEQAKRRVPNLIRWWGESNEKVAKVTFTG